MATQRKTQPDLPDCPQIPLAYKPVPMENGNGKPLIFCAHCDGSGTTCTATKEIASKGVAGVVYGATEILKAEFPGSQSARYQKQGYKVTPIRYPVCNGAGLVKEEEQ
ncbi:hypothetical protein [Mesorhizobium sp. M8A.F.Ca.ET.165.01.1.1]|uniref:hypothetical protein n=1 Tax=Mesorhizobium sp. M8A.F.Ca.ET.165.01.1.1 TaxID=2563960 RepID=UPI001093B7B6|nr:hypothetical protein [Mesorhizobium sp. M8A.F.Ca.ET.165.01.1.1]TGT42769.1 hypothetical protein EN808_12875 [Mesorhizobium sp. M8A.F.Ca.ET.165.01.1.1]